MKFIPEAPLKSQCSEDYFYSADPSFEKYLQMVEGRSESYFKEICAADTLPKDLAHQDIVTSMNIRGVEPGSSPSKLGLQERLP